MAECSNGELSDEDIIINDQDGLPNVHPNLISEAEIDSPEQHSDDEFEDLPSSLIVTNIHDSVFITPDKKRDLEDLFKKYDPNVTFQWLRSFRRLRVNFKTPFAAASARIELHQYKINESVITCYFAQPVTPVKNPNLQPPAPYKQFLISPPASPPLDWEPRVEGEPIINHDLLAAIATLSPGATHELHPSSPGQPSIVVHTALGAPNTGTKPRIMHTAAPDRT
ncbi:protein sarah [Diorhabda carinulata]|uniref:protein sarah n=1 Tax=Diorhabda sublineata TaxID=1163346 RepID=UPI0024E14EF7|nr:protein sarah [Diorhabda sublineata]XP_056648706.1 protein sarah [Diorhabda sublineata]XP_057668102.1 protein sarah [Diorhabda carinulata]XP_057668103.1 protein sarah [Diorhabda carinulata]XP_057668104.1 protein sarah [Diorhabda carinulata]